MISLTDATIERKARWLRTEGQEFTANLLEALWRDVRQRERFGRVGGPEFTYMLDIDTERFTVIRLIDAKPR